jgi:hypothetical protein
MLNASDVWKSRKSFIDRKLAEHAWGYGPNSIASNRNACPTVLTYISKEDSLSSHSNKYNPETHSLSTSSIGRAPNVQMSCKKSWAFPATAPSATGIGTKISIYARGNCFTPFTSTLK